MFTIVFKLTRSIVSTDLAFVRSLDVCVFCVYVCARKTQTNKHNDRETWLKRIRFLLLFFLKVSLEEQTHSGLCDEYEQRGSSQLV